MSFFSRCCQGYYLTMFLLDAIKHDPIETSRIPMLQLRYPYFGPLLDYMSQTFPYAFEDGWEIPECYTR